jgi:hypothetical protein
MSLDVGPLVAKMYDVFLATAGVSDELRLIRCRASGIGLRMDYVPGLWLWQRSLLQPTVQLHLTS